MKVEKKYYSFDELKTLLGVTTNELHYLIQTAEIIPAISGDILAEPMLWKSDDGNPNKSYLHVADRYDFLEDDPHKDYGLREMQGWVYLRLPEESGAYNYIFQYLTKEMYATYTEFKLGEWYKSALKFDAKYIEAHAVFMEKTIDNYLVFSQGLDGIESIKKSPAITPSNNPTNANDIRLTDRERQTLLVIIAALAKEANVDIAKTSKAGYLIANMTQLIGVPIGATTIETHLKKIKQALVSRAK